MDSPEIRRHVLESIVDPFLASDSQCRYNYVNDAAVALLGKTHDQLLGHHVLEVFPELEGSPFYRAMLRAVEERAGTNLTDYYPPHDRWYECRFFPAEQGGFCVIFSDYTDRRQGLERLKLALDAGNMGTWDADLVAETFSVDDRLAELLGLPTEGGEFPIAKALAFIPDEDRARLRADHDDPALPASYVSELRWQAPGQNLIWLASRGTVLRDVRGNPVRLIGVAFDITEKKKAEEHTQRLNLMLKKRIEEQDEDLRMLSASVPAFFAYIDHDLSFRFLNQRLEEHFSTPDSPLLGKSVREAFGADDYLQLEPRLLSALQGRELEFEMNLHIPQSGRRVARIHLTPRNDPANGTTGILFLATDITEERRLQQDVLVAMEEEKTRIGGDIHDSICQELGAIGFFAKALEARLQLEGHPASADASKLVRQMNDTNQKTRKLARGLSPLLLEELSLPDALRGLASNASELFPQTTCSFHCRSPIPDLANATATQLYFIAREAVFNAARHGEPRFIRIELGVTRHHLSLTVSDDGTGILSKLTEGLGLRSMRYRARTLDGRLDVEGRQNGPGLMVRCHIPLPFRP